MSRGDGTDNCAQGLFCNGLGTVPTCQPYCSVSQPASCNTVCTELHVGPVGMATASGYGVCQPSCSMLEQDCAQGDACVFVESEFPVCATPGQLAPGDDCANYDDCETGSACVLVNTTQTAYMCTPFCEPTQPSACDAEGEACLAFPMIYQAVPEALLAVGLCYPCALLGIEGCALLAPGGCAEPADCQPLLEMMGFAYTCSLPTGQCVMLEL